MKTTKRTVINGAVGTVVYNETGEIFQTNEDDRIVVEKKVEREYCDKFQNEVNFVKIFNGSASRLVNTLTAQELQLTMRLVDHVCYNDCVLRYKGIQGNRILALNDMADLFDMNYETLRRTMNGLIDKGVVGVFKTVSEEKKIKTYIVNPFIYIRGCSVKNSVIDYFRDTIWAAPDSKE